MSRAAAGPRPAGRLVPVLWAGLAVAGALVAGALAGVSDGAAVPPLAGTGLTALAGTAVRAGTDAAGVACVGLGLVGVLVPGSNPRGAEVRARANRAMVGVAGAWLVLVPIGIAVRAAAVFARPVTELAGADLLLYTTRLASGRGAVLAAICTAVVLGCAVARIGDPERVPVRVPLVAALLGVITPAATGHTSGAADHGLALMMIAPHVGAAALWVGGLGAVLVLVRRKPLLDVALPRFSRLAGGCLGVTAVTGVLTFLLSAGSFREFYATSYGRLVLAKAAALVLLAFLGNLARRRLARNTVPVLRWAGLEVAVMATTIGLAAALAQTGS